MLLLSELGGKRVNNPCGFWKDAYNHLATVGRDNSIRDTRAVEYRAFLYKVRGSTQFGSVLQYQDIHENICVALPGDPFSLDAIRPGFRTKVRSRFGYGKIRCCVT